jgi:hypothetical protein
MTEFRTTWKFLSSSKPVLLYCPQEIMLEEIKSSKKKIFVRRDKILQKKDIVGVAR